MNTNIKGDFQICISVPLINGYYETHYVYIKIKYSPENDIQIHETSLIKDFFSERLSRNQKNSRQKWLTLSFLKDKR